MNTELLRAFIAVADSGVLTEAAKKLHRTQSAVTKSIQRLEQMLGGVLFDRVGNRLVLNHRGKLLLETAFDLIRKEEDLIKLSQAIETDQLQTFNIAFDSLIPFQQLAYMVDLNSKYLSAMNIRFLGRIFDGAYKLVERGEADIAVTAMLKDSGDLQSKFIGELEVVNAVVSSAPEDYWKTLPQCILGDTEDKETESNIVSISKRMRVETIEHKYALIANGHAWGRIPLLLGGADVEQKKLAIRDAPGVYTRQKLPIYCVFNKDQQSNLKYLFSKL